MKMKRIFSILLTLALCLSLLPAVTLPAGAAWSGDGDGTAANPYQIGTKAELEKFRDIVNGDNGETQNTAACAVLTADIDLGGVEGDATTWWTPIDGYGGTFDGGGHTVSGLYVSGDLNHAGLFGGVDDTGTVKNLSVSGSVSSSGGAADVGGVAGTSDKGTIQNCRSTCSVSGSGNGAFVGGIVGSNLGTVRNCCNTGSVSGSGVGNNVGGIVGYQYYGDAVVECCDSTGGVSGSGDGTRVGGIIAIINGTTAKSCYYLDGTAPDVVGLDIGGSTVTDCAVLSADAFKQQASFPGWDFHAIWRMGTDAPELRKGTETDPREPATWSELYDALQLGGYSKLAADVKYGAGGGDHASDSLTVPAGVTATLDLNGHIVDRGLTGQAAVESGRVLTVSGNLTLTDGNFTASHNPNLTYTDPITNDAVTVKGGVLTGGSCWTGGGVCVEKNGTFTMEGGKIAGNLANGSGGGVYVRPNGTFTMKNNAEVRGNKAEGEGAVGGGVYVSGTFTMSDSASVAGNQASNHGGGVYASGTVSMSGSASVSGNKAGNKYGGVYASGTFTMSGSASVTGNAAAAGTGGVEVAGTFNVSGRASVTGNHKGTDTAAADYNSNVKVRTGCVITITDELKGAFGVTLAEGYGIAPFTEGWYANMSGQDVTEYFTSDDDTYQVGLNGGEAALAETVFDVTFDPGGGSPAPAEQPVVSGGTAVEPSFPRYAGHAFAGWYDGETEWDFSAAISTELTLTAKWTPLPALALGTDMLCTDVNTGNAQIVHFGGLNWYVIACDGKDRDGNTLQYERETDGQTVDLYPQGTATLLAAATDRSGQFNKSWTGSADYVSSDLKKSIDGDNGLLSGFSAQEKAAITSRTLEGGGKTYGDPDYDSNKMQGETVENALLWPLSVAEARQMGDDLRHAVAYGPYHTGFWHDSWWLRTPGINPQNAAYVASDSGKVNRVGEKVWNGNYNEVHPACYLDLSSVLLASPATDGKASGTTGQNALKKVGGYTGNEWKLTVKDDGRKNFTAAFAGRTGDVWTIKYSGAVSGDNEYISAVIVNASGAVTYYGRLAAASAEANSTCTVNVSGKLGGTDTLYVFNEQANGNNKTDYASALCEIVPHVHDFTYSASGAVITAACSNADGNCPLPAPDHKVTLTLVKPAKAEYHDDGIPAATLNEQELSAFNAATGKSVAATDIKYVGRGDTNYPESGTAPTAAGTYTAKLTLTGVKTSASASGSVTASVDYAIAKAPQTAVPAGVTVSSIGSDSVWLTGVQGEEYVIAPKGTATPDWTGAKTPDEYGTVELPDLNEATEYTVFARVAETDNFLPGPAVTQDVTTYLTGYGGGGSGIVGGTMTARAELEGGSSDIPGLSYAWYLDGQAIDGETGESYVIREGDVGKVLGARPFKNGAPLWDEIYELCTPDFATVNIYKEYKEDPDQLELLKTETGLKYGDTVNAPETPARSGYAFAGWQEGFFGAFEDVTFPLTVEDSMDIYAKWTPQSSGGGGGGGGSASHSVSMASGSSAHGTVKLSTASARAGEKVTVTPQPDAGYQLTSLTVTDAKGNVIPVNKNADGTYTFTMPATAVTITPVFEEIAGPVDPDDPDDPDNPDNPAAGDVSARFRDVKKGAWYHDAVQWAVDKGLMNGVGEDTFDPNGTATRAMVVTMLWRMAGEPVVNYYLPYTDVDQDAWYAEAVRWAASAGAVNGTGADTFSPNEPVTREQLAAILYRFAQNQGKGFTGAWMFLLDYSDADQVSDWANEAMHWMVMQGVITGMGDGTLAPQANATRAQIAAMFQRFAAEMEK